MYHVLNIVCLVKSSKYVIEAYWRKRSIIQTVASLNIVFLVFTEKQTILSPIVLCGPTGMVLNKPIVLSMQHCASMRHGGWQLSVCSSNTPLEVPPHWQVRTPKQKYTSSFNKSALQKVITIWAAQILLFMLWYRNYCVKIGCLLKHMKKTFH